LRIQFPTTIHMKYVFLEGDLAQHRTPCLVTSLKVAKKTARALGAGAIFSRATQDFKDKRDSTLCVNLDGAVARLLIVGGADEALDASAFTKLANAFAPALTRLPINQATIALEHVRAKGQSAAWKAATVMQACSHASYQFTKHKSQSSSDAKLSRIRIHSLGQSNAGVRQAIRAGNALDQGLAFAKDLGNEPPNVCNPTFLLREARKLAKDPRVTVTDLNEKKMQELGMGAFMAVSRGSDTPGHMIVIKYNGGKRGDAPVVLIGKGITFDTGGISLKPPAAMDEMKFDMCGAASVMGATKAAIEAGLKLNLVTIVAAAENMPSGEATRPGDIVTSYSGQTIEILNTDAEGRLVLCDAITYAEKLRPKSIIDVATLTGACIVALGSHASAMYANDDALAQALERAADESGDRIWRLPLWDDYAAPLKSNFADMANVGGREAGSVVAACFLRKFVSDTPWSHLDIAGSAFHSGARKGASGRPVPLLFSYLSGQSS
jgi:leucyl aminopeptidase